MERVATLTTVGAIVFLAGSASGAYIDNMFVSTDPASYGSLEASLVASDAALQGPYQFDVPPGKVDSGFARETIIGGQVFSESDRTEMRTDVYRVQTPQVFNDGSDSISLNVGDLVFAYTIRLTSANSNTVNTLAEVGIAGLTFAGQDALATSLVKGRGIYLDASLPANAQPTGVPVQQNPGGDLLDAGSFGGGLDWDWLSTAGDQLQNEEQITLLMFTKPALIGNGAWSLASPAGQADTSTTFIDDGAPALIPLIPAPASVLVLGVGALGIARRRR